MPAPNLRGQNLAHLPLEITSAIGHVYYYFPSFGLVNLFNAYLAYAPVVRLALVNSWRIKGHISLFKGLYGGQYWGWFGHSPIHSKSFFLSNPNVSVVSSSICIIHHGKCKEVDLSSILNSSGQ